MKKPNTAQFENCIKLLICLACKRYIGYGAGYYTINFDDDPDARAFMHSTCAESDYIDDGEEEEDDDEDGHVYSE
jgi:hypothetical protein